MSTILNDFLVDVADAIRDVEGSDSPIVPTSFSTRIRNVQSGNGGADNFLIETTDTLTVEIKPNTFTKCGPRLSSTLTVSLQAPTNTSIVNEYVFAFYANSGSAELVLPDSIVWANDNELIVESGYTYIVSIMDNIALYMKVAGNVYNMEKPQLGYDPDCAILYTTRNGELGDFSNYDVVDANLISNTYENGQGVLLYDAPVEVLGGDAFCDLGSDYGKPNTMVLPSTITDLGDYAFYATSGISALYIKATTPPIQRSGFFEQGNIPTIYVPMESVDLYVNHDDWKWLSSRIQGYNFE